MKSIDVFCHLMPPEYAKICMAEAPNKSHMFVRALKVPSMSKMESRNEVLKEFPGYKQIPNIVSPPVETFAGPDKSHRLAAIGNDEIKKIVEANPEFYEGFIAGIPFNNVQASVEEIKRVKDMGAKGIQIYTHMNGEAIDTEKYWPIYEACEKYDLPILIHPVCGQTHHGNRGLIGPANCEPQLIFRTFFRRKLSDIFRNRPASNSALYRI